VGEASQGLSPPPLHPMPAPPAKAGGPLGNGRRQGCPRTLTPHWVAVWPEDRAGRGAGKPRRRDPGGPSREPARWAPAREGGGAVARTLGCWPPPALLQPLPAAGRAPGLSGPPGPFGSRHPALPAARAPPDLIGLPGAAASAAGGGATGEGKEGGNEKTKEKESTAVPRSCPRGMVGTGTRGRTPLDVTGRANGPLPPIISQQDAAPGGHPPCYIG